MCILRIKWGLQKESFCFPYPPKLGLEKDHHRQLTYLKVTSKKCVLYGSTSEKQPAGKKVPGCIGYITKLCLGPGGSQSEPRGRGCQIEPWFQSWLHSQGRTPNPVLSLCFLICQLVRILVEARYLQKHLAGGLHPASVPSGRVSPMVGLAQHTASGWAGLERRPLG